MFSLCIATMDRYDEFLSKYLPKYLEIELINEIIISDENGNDVAKIREAFPNHPKLRLFVNEYRMGPLMNKLRACSHAQSEWIALIDSDNFAGEDYFNTAKKYVDENILYDKEHDSRMVILAPCKASPNFDYSHLSGVVYKRGDFADINEYERSVKQSQHCSGTTLMNTGNYIINKYIIDNVDLSREKNIHMSSSSDVIYFNTILFEQFDLHLHVVPNMIYEHVVHNGSIYLQTHNQCSSFAEAVHARYYSLV